jgi:CRP/FNR family transcriptional regulator, cyclic AMP receptor protein
MEDKIWYLKDINILRNLNDSQRMKLGSFCTMAKYDRGELVYLPGDTRNIYFLKMGAIKLITKTEEGDDIVKEVLEKGEIFGKCFGGENDELREKAVAVEDSMVCYLPFDHWQEFLKEHLDLSLSILKWTGMRIRRLERKMDALYFKSMDSRVKDVLLDLALRLGKRDNVSGDILIPVHLTHEELARLAGCSRQNVTAILNELRTGEWIDYSRNRILVKKRMLDGSEK